jgi:hypothetical protein
MSGFFPGDIDVYSIVNSQVELHLCISVRDDAMFAIINRSIRKYAQAQDYYDQSITVTPHQRWENTQGYVCRKLVPK